MSSCLMSLSMSRKRTINSSTLGFPGVKEGCFLFEWLFRFFVLGVWVWVFLGSRITLRLDLTQF